MVAFMQNTAHQYYTAHAYILVSTSEIGSVDFDVTTTFTGVEETTMYSVSSTQPTQVDFPAGVYVTDIVQRDKAILVEARDNKEISVIVFNDEEFSSDGFVALPCDGMAVGGDFRQYDYLILSTNQDSTRASQFLIITCEDSTTVTVIPSTRVSGSGVFQHTQFGPDIAQTSSKWQINNSPSLSAKQTLLIYKVADDLTGTLVRGTKPLVVISGHQCGQVLVGSSGCDHMSAQIPPHTTWSYTFLLNPLDVRMSGDLYRFATLMDDTEVTITCVEAGGSTASVEYQATLQSAVESNWGEFQTHSGSCASLRKFCTLQSTQPVLVGQYSYSSSSDESCGKAFSDELGDPFLMIIPPVVQYSHSYNLVPITLTSDAVLARRLSVSVYVSYFNPAAIMLDDAPLEPSVSEWQAVYCSTGQICGYSITKALNDDNQHTVFHTDQNSTLLVQSYGFMISASYGLTAGMELQPISGESFNNIILFFHQR